MAGVDIRTVAKLMGHKTITVTMRYSHLAPEHELSAVERLVTAGRSGTRSGTASKRAKRRRRSVEAKLHLLNSL